MRIVICVEEDLVGCLVLNRLLEGLRRHALSVFVSRREVELGNAPLEFRELLAVQCEIPSKIIFPLIDLADAPPGDLVTFQGARRRYEIPVTFVESVGLAFDKSLNAFKPDVLVSARFSFIFRKETLLIPRLAALNVHPGQLPEYAGKHSPLHALADGARQLGCSVIQMDEGIDTGPIVGSGGLKVDQRRTLLWHIIHAYDPGIDIVCDVVHQLEQGGRLESSPQDRSRRKYRRYLASQEIRKLVEGFHLFEWAELREIFGQFLDDKRSGVPE